MIKSLISKIKNIDKSIKNLMLHGVEFSIFVCLISSSILFTYELFYNLPDLYYIGLSIFKMGITFISGFLACGFAFNEIKQQI